METIFTLLIFILPIVFKLIGKKLEKAAGQQQTVLQPEPKVEPVPEQMQKVATKKQTKPAVKASKPILKEEPKKVGEKIDKKKLIVYSEIMKPKYME